MDIENRSYVYTGPGGQKRRVRIERIHSFSQLQKGDHIAITRLYGVYWHHAIVEYVETKRIRVIEYSRNEFLQNFGDPWSREKAIVMKGEYGLEGDWYVIKHPDDTCLPADDVVARARSKLGEGGYDPFENNCEHFVTWCKTGTPSSEQIKIAEEKAINTAITIGTAVVVQLVYEQR